MKKNVDLLNGKILPVLVNLALPIMATSMIQMAYNLTDMAWIGKVGSGAVTSVGTGGMYLWLSSGVVALAKMGGQVKVAHSLGENREKDSVEYAKGAIQLTIFLAVVFALTANVFADELIGFFGLQSQEVIHNAVVYLRITCGFIAFSFLSQTMTGLYTAIGDSKTPLKANAIGLAANMILDPLLILGTGGFPRFGVAGAAAATVIAQGIVLFILTVYAIKEPVLLSKINLFKKTRPGYFLIMMRIGFPAAVQNMLYCGISMVLTRFVTGWGDAAVAVQRVGGQVESISWMTADGFGMAINAFTGQNYGGKQYKRVKQGYLTASAIMAVWGIFTTSVLVFLAEPIFGVFIHEAEIMPAGIDYLKIIGYGQMFMCIELLTVGALSGLGKTFECSILSIVFTSARVPLAYILGRTVLGLNGIWWALTITSVLKGVVFFTAYLRILSKPYAEEKAWRKN